MPEPEPILATLEPLGTKQIPNYLKFVFGGMAGMCATVFVQPFDVIKTRMQVSVTADGKKEFKNSLDCAQNILNKEGVPGLYKGLTAGLLRQATYSTTRLGAYSYLNTLYSSRYEGNPSVGASMLMGIIAGSIGAFVGTPAEVALIRMQADGRLPPAERRNYTHVGNALMRIIKEENIGALYRGCIPTTARGAVVNMTQLASYSQFKYFFSNTFGMKEGLPMHFGASMLSGFLTTLTSMPLDMAKTRIQNMKTVDGKPEYTSTGDVIVKVIKNEGPFALWKGLTPYFFRIGPHTVLMFIFLEQFNGLYTKYMLSD